MSKVKKGIGTINNGDEVTENLANPVEIQIAQFKVERYKRSYDIAIDQLTNIAKWLNASLFAINSGGILTILNNYKALNDIQTAGILFILGIIASLLNATVNQEMYNRISESILNMVDYWSEVSITGEENEETHDKIEQKMNDIKKYFWIGPAIGGASGLLFIAGVINVAINLK